MKIPVIYKPFHTYSLFNKKPVPGDFVDGICRKLDIFQYNFTWWSTFKTRLVITTPKKPKITVLVAG